MRQILDEQGRAWEPVTIPIRGAHLRTGAVLGFRLADQPDKPPIATNIKFNSEEAAAGAVEQMGDFELRRRLEWARTAAGVR